MTTSSPPGRNLGLSLSPGECFLFRGISGSWGSPTARLTFISNEALRGSLALSWLPGEACVVDPQMQVYGHALLFLVC